MRGSTGALRAIGLLIGFYVVTLGTLLVLAGVDVLLVLRTDGDTPVFAQGKVIGATVVVAVPIVRGLMMARRRGGNGQSGVVVTPRDQPELWARVRGLARQIGTRPPGEIRLVPLVNAAVSEDAHMLGLLPGRRRMYIGVPLLVGLTSAQLDAVLAHELGHYSSRDVRMAAAIVRGQDAMIGVASRCHEFKGRFPQGLMSSFFAWYAELYLRTSQSLRRRQELAADRMAVRIAGRDNTAAALRRMPVLDTAYGIYLDQYVSVGWAAGVLPFPEEFYAGLRALLADPSRRRELAELRETPAERDSSPYDSHPPTGERIAAVESWPGDGRAPVAAEPEAINLLRSASRVCAQVATLALPPEAATTRCVGWSELADAAGRASLIRDASPILQSATAVTGGRVTDLPSLLNAVDAGWWERIADALPKSQEAQRATGRVAREFARTGFRRATASLVLLAVVDAGRARWTHSWARPLRLEFDQGWEAAVATALDFLIAEPPDTRPLRRLLRGIASVPDTDGFLTGR